MKNARHVLGLSIFILLIAVFLVSSTVFAAEIKPPTPSSVSITDLPDLTATIEFTVTGTYISEGITCYQTNRTITVINNGKKAAKNFNVLMEWNYPGKNSNQPDMWQQTTEYSNETLGPGQKKIYGVHPVNVMGWCPNETWKPAWRVTVDSKGSVVESKEDNNQVTKTYVPLSKRLKEIPMRERTR